VAATVFETVLDGGGDLRCTVTAGTAIRLATLEGPLATLRHDGEGLRVTVDGNADFADAFLPAAEGSELRVIIDAGMLELSGRKGIMAVPLPIVASPVTLTVSGAAGTLLLSTVTKPSVQAEDPHLAATSLPYLLG
jgi:beta-fructofuranosidase